MNIHDRARKMAAQSASPMTQGEALAVLGQRGAAKRQARRQCLKTETLSAIQKPAAYWWQKDNL